MTNDLADLYYKEHLKFYCPPFSIWMEDVYIGMLAKKYSIWAFLNIKIPRRWYQALP